VPTLVPPTTTVLDSFLRAMAEIRAEGRGGDDDHTMIGAEFRRHGATWHTPAGFASYLADLRTSADPDHPRPSGLVACTTFWWTDGDTFLGRIAVRHQLTERLRIIGGHIGYDIRPTARRQGHATAMLRAACHTLARSA
jgi:predicted acetyltransferase